MRNFIIPTVLVLLSFFSFFWYTKPAYDNVGELRASIAEHDTALERVTEIQEIRDQLLSRYNSLPESSLYLLSKILPDEIDTVRFLIELDQIATEHGLTIQEPSYEDPNESEEGSSNSYQPTIVTFTIAGSYEDVLAFIRDVEQSARLMDIMGLKVAAESASSPSGSVPSGELNAYTFTVQTYSLSGLPQQE